jgi:hypothetical protein
MMVVGANTRLSTASEGQLGVRGKVDESVYGEGRGVVKLKWVCALKVESLIASRPITSTRASPSRQ